MTPTVAVQEMDAHEATLSIIFNDGIQHGAVWAGMVLDKTGMDPNEWRWHYILETRGQCECAVQEYKCIHDLVVAANELYPIDQWTKV